MDQLLIMKFTALNRCLKPLTWLLVIVIIFMLLIPAELSNEQLAQIQPGMTMVEVNRRIGNSNVREGWSVLAIGDPGSSEGETVAMWDQSERWLQPRVEALIPDGNSIKLNTTQRASFWVGKSSLLWIEHDNEKVLKVWLIPVTKKGGGFQGCINTFREYWNKWWK